MHRSRIPKKLAHPSGVERSTEEVALRQVAPSIADQRELLLGLDSFGCDAQPEGVSQCSDGSDQSGG